MIDHLDDLLDVGLSSLKIEGRAKSAYYAAIVTGAYRHCLDDAAAGRPIDPVWRDEVEHVSHRPYATGFYYGYPGQYYENSRYIREWRWWRWSRNVAPTATLSFPCGTSSAPVTRWSW